MKILALFGGQGVANARFYELLRGDPEAGEYLSEAFQKANLDPSQAASIVKDPHYAQVLIGIYQLVLFSFLRREFASHEMEMAGYSLGEVPAFLLSIQADLASSIEVLRYRTLLMKTKTNAYDLASIRSQLDRKELESLCRRFDCEVAIIQGSGHFIIGGEISKIHALLAYGKESLMRPVYLSIYQPSHTSFYREQSDQFSEFLQRRFQGVSMIYPIISPLEGKLIDDAQEEMTLLGRELSSPLDWEKVCGLIPEYGYELILDLGPGAAMTAILNISSDHKIFEEAPRLAKIVYPSKFKSWSRELQSL